MPLFSAVFRLIAFSAINIYGSTINSSVWACGNSSQDELGRRGGGVSLNSLQGELEGFANSFQDELRMC